MGGMHKQLAVLVGGEYREFDLAHKSWNFLDSEISDVFFSTWNSSHELNEDLSIDLTEEVSEDKIKRCVPHAKIMIEPDKIINPYFKDHSMFKVLYHWRNLLLMLINSENSYDAVVLTRPDMFLKNFNVLDIISASDFSYDLLYQIGQVDIPPPPSYLYVNDCFFLGSTKIMTRFLSTSVAMEQTQEAEKSIHYYLARNILNNDIPTKDIISIFPELKTDFFVMRSIHRNQFAVKTDEGFELWWRKQKQLAAWWWKTKHSRGR